MFRVKEVVINEQSSLKQQQNKHISKCEETP